MSTEENKAIARLHFKEVLEQGHVELIEGYYAPTDLFQTCHPYQPHSNGEILFFGGTRPRRVSRSRSWT